MWSEHLEKRWITHGFDSAKEQTDDLNPRQYGNSPSLSERITYTSVRYAEVNSSSGQRASVETTEATKPVSVGCLGPPARRAQ